MDLTCHSMGMKLSPTEIRDSPVAPVAERSGPKIQGGAFNVLQKGCAIINASVWGLDRAHISNIFQAEHEYKTYLR